MKHQVIQLLLCGLAFAGFNSPVSGEFKSTGVPQYDSAVKKGVAFLKSANVKPNEHSLVAYALFKAGESPDSEGVKQGIDAAIKRADANGYSGYEHIYLSGVDSMLLADVSADRYAPQIQVIADHVAATQRQDGSWAESNTAAGDMSMAQYAMLALWAADRAGCTIDPNVVERAARWHLANGGRDSGWVYRPGTTQGHEQGRTSHNMTMAGAGSLSIARLLLHGPKAAIRQAPTKKFGVLEAVKENQPLSTGSFPNHSPQVSVGELDGRIDRAFGWNTSRFSANAEPIHQKNYFYYAFERAASLHGVKQVPGGDWFTVYGRGLLSLQDTAGAFSKTTLTDTAGTSFAILFFMKSTAKIIQRQFGTGVMRGGRDLASLYGKEKVKKKDLGPLDALLREMENADLSSLDNIDADELADKITVTSRDELIGQIDLLKKLVGHKDASNRGAAYYALGRTGDLSLIPEILKGLRDPNLDVAVTALEALR